MNLPFAKATLIACLSLAITGCVSSGSGTPKKVADKGNPTENNGGGDTAGNGGDTAGNGGDTAGNGGDTAGNGGVAVPTKEDYNNKPYVVVIGNTRWVEEDKGGEEFIPKAAADDAKKLNGSKDINASKIFAADNGDQVKFDGVTPSGSGKDDYVTVSKNGYEYSEIVQASQVYRNGTEKRHMIAYAGKVTEADQLANLSGDVTYKGKAFASYYQPYNYGVGGNVMLKKYDNDVTMNVAFKANGESTVSGTIDMKYSGDPKTVARINLTDGKITQENDTLGFAGKASIEHLAEKNLEFVGKNPKLIADQSKFSGAFMGPQAEEMAGAVHIKQEKYTSWKEDGYACSSSYCDNIEDINAVFNAKKQ